MDGHQLAAWIDSYVDAWSTNEPADIVALFSEGARYYTAPWREPWEGHDGILEGWLEEQRDDPGTWRFRYEVLAASGELGFVRGWTDYTDGDRYDNLWIVRLGPDGLCSEFTEWFMEPS